MTVKDPHNKKIPVLEIFGPTVQGEGLVIGTRTFFIRFGLCDYRCKMCDSMHAVDPGSVKANARYLTQRQIFDEVKSRMDEHNCAWVTLSGGNPAMHDLTELCTLLKFDEKLISIETQGTIAPMWIGLCDYITISPKGPGMGEQF